MSDSRHVESIELEPPVSISRIVHTLRTYAAVILLSLAAVATAYIVIAVAAYIFSPSQRLTSQKFRLDFEGASEGLYPNRAKFSTSDIVSTPVLLRVFQDNHLDRFTRFVAFSRALFVLESNPDYERLAADYQARLADPKLSAIDRERIQREWESKAAALAKGEYTLNWLRTSDTADVPEPVVRKVLLDTLATWARYVTNEQHVLKYRLGVLSSNVIGVTADDNSEPIVQIQVLRSKIYKILQNIDDLLLVPGSELRRSRDGMSLPEIRLRLEEIVRFRLEPLTARVSASGLVADRTATQRFLEMQLAYDQRKLKSAQDSADTIRQSLTVYSLDQNGYQTPQTAGSPPREQQAPRNAGDTVAPQLSESFLDRLVSMTSRTSDMQYRQKLVDDYRRAAMAVVPAEEAVAYDQEVLNLIRGGGSSNVRGNDAQAEIAATRNDVRRLTDRVNEIYDAVSHDLNPSNELYTLTAPPVSRTQHARSLTQLALYGVVLLAVATPIIIVLCLLHARVREEEAQQAFVEAEAATS